MNMEPKLSIVFPVLNQHELFKEVYKTVKENTNQSEQPVEFVIIDNGSDTPLDGQDFPGGIIIRNEKSTGVYPTFKQGFDSSKGEVVAFFHSDLVIWEKDWNLRVLEQFDNHPEVGMVGFIGSGEIDPDGGRGLGTMSNFQGRVLYGETSEKTPSVWSGSHASVHGKVSGGVSNVAVVDGCAMIIRRSAWEEIGYRENFPIHHFYDRLISTQLLENEYTIKVIGVECDHFSGQTVCQEDKYHKLAEEWCRENVPESEWVYPPGGAINWDATVYRTAEKQWLKEFRDDKYLIPIRV